MDRETGFSSANAPYEYTVREKSSHTLIFKRTTLIAIYVLWAVIWLMVGVVTRVLAPFLALIPISLWILVFLTWRLTQVEYEYSFFSGTLTVSRILGGRSRRELAKVTIREIGEIFPCDGEHSAQIDRFGAQKTLLAASSSDAPDLYALLWRAEDGTACALFLEANEKARRILRYYNPSAFAARGHR